MHHVAIMKKSWNLIPKIISGEKTIESRWYQTRRIPWNGVRVGDVIYFKNSGEPVIAKASVSKVLQFEMEHDTDVKKIVKKFGKDICLVERDISKWDHLPRYSILMWLKNPQKIKIPFYIHKRGFGANSAWITVPHIRNIHV